MRRVKNQGSLPGAKHLLAKHLLAKHLLAIWLSTTPRKKTSPLPGATRNIQMFRCLMAIGGTHGVSTYTPNSVLVLYFILVKRIKSTTSEIIAVKHHSTSLRLALWMNMEKSVAIAVIINQQKKSSIYSIIHTALMTRWQKRTQHYMTLISV